MDHGADFIVERDLSRMVRRMNELTGEDLLDEATVRREITARDREIANPFTKDLQVTAIHGARRYLGDRLIRTAAPHRILDPKAGPLIAVRLSILTRKSLGGLETDLSSRVLTPSGEPLSGVYAAGEAAGFGGGGVHGYRPWRARSWAAASSRPARRAARPPPPSPDPTRAHAPGPGPFAPTCPLRRPVDSGHPPVRTLTRSCAYRFAVSDHPD